MGDQYNICNVRAFGAVGSGVKDDTVAIQNAIEAAAAAGAAVYVPAGNYLLSGSGTELLLVESAVTIFGESQDTSILYVAGDVPATTDVIRYHAPASPVFRYFSLSGIRISPLSGAPARHAIVIDTTDGSIAYATFSRLGISQLGGRAFATVNPTLADGFYLSSIENCLLTGGVLLSRGGDSIAIRHNKILGAGSGIEADLVAGANLLNIVENNITSAGPAIKIGRAVVVNVQGNNIETVAGGNYPTVPVLHFLGDEAGSCTPYVIGNGIGAWVDDTDAILLDRATNAYIGPNEIAIDGTGAGIRTTANTVAPKVDLDAIRWLGTSSTKLVDVSTQALKPTYGAVE